LTTVYVFFLIVIILCCVFKFVWAELYIRNNRTMWEMQCPRVLPYFGDAEDKDDWSVRIKGATTG